MIAVVIATLLVVFGSASILGILLRYPQMSLNALQAFGQTAGRTFFNTIYVTPWCRISPYAAGLLVGFLVISPESDLRCLNA